MGVTKTGPYRWRITTDEKHVITVDSKLISSEWEKIAAYAGQKVFYLVYTAFVGYGSPLTVRCKTGSGKTLAEETKSVFDNYLRDAFVLPDEMEEGETVYFEADSVKNNLFGTSKPVPVHLRPYVKNLAWSKETAERDDIITLSADVKNTADRTPALLTIYECNAEGFDDRICAVQKEVMDGRVELMWAYLYHGDQRRILTKKEAAAQNLTWAPPRYMFTVTIGSEEFGRETRESGLLNIAVEGAASASVLEFEDALFCKGSSVLLPNRREKIESGVNREITTGVSVLKTLLLFADANRKMQLVILGHSASGEAGKDAMDISRARAEGVRCLVENDKEQWAAVCTRRHTVEDIQYILSWAGYSPGPIDGIEGEKTRRALRAFQRDAGLKVDGVAGEKTFGAFFEKYQASLEAMMNDDNGKRALKNRGAIAWLYSLKAAGCGGSFPKVMVDKENLINTTDNWVEALFFDPEEVPDCICKDECDGAGCLIYKPRYVSRTPIGAKQTVLSKAVIQFQLYSESGAAYAKKSYTTKINDVEDTQDTDDQGWTLPINVCGIKEGKISYEGLTYSFQVDETAPSDLIQAKSALNALGYGGGALDDEITDTLEGVVKQYQASASLQQTGKVDVETLNSLKKAHVLPFGPE